MTESEEYMFNNFETLRLKEITIQLSKNCSGTSTN